MKNKIKQSTSILMEYNYDPNMSKSSNTHIGINRAEAIPRMRAEEKAANERKWLEHCQNFENWFRCNPYIEYICTETSRGIFSNWTEYVEDNINQYKMEKVLEELEYRREEKAAETAKRQHKLDSNNIVMPIRGHITEDPDYGTCYGYSEADKRCNPIYIHIKPQSLDCIPTSGSYCATINKYNTIEEEMEYISYLKEKEAYEAEQLEIKKNTKVLLHESFGYKAMYWKASKIIAKTRGLNPNEDIRFMHELVHYNPENPGAYSSGKWCARHDHEGKNDFTIENYVAYIDGNTSSSNIKEVLKISLEVPTTIVVRPEEDTLEDCATGTRNFSIYTDVKFNIEDVEESYRKFFKEENIKPLERFLVDWYNMPTKYMEDLTEEDVVERVRYTPLAQAHAYQGYEQFFKEEHGIEENYLYYPTHKEVNHRKMFFPEEVYVTSHKDQDPDHPFKITKDAVKCRKHFNSIMDNVSFQIEKNYLDYTDKLYKDGDEIFNPKYFGYIPCPKCGHEYMYEFGECPECGHQIYYASSYYDDNWDAVDPTAEEAYQGAIEEDSYEDFAMAMLGITVVSEDEETL